MCESFKSSTLADLDDLLGFIEAQSLPHFSPQLSERILTHLTTPEEWIDVWENGERRAVAAIVQSCDSADNSASFDVLAIKGSLSGDIKKQAIIRGISIAKTGTRSLINFALWKGLTDWQREIEALNFKYSYSGFKMTQKKTEKPWLPPPPPKPSLSWVTTDETNIHLYYRVLKRSFSNIPGAFIPDLEEMRRSLRSGSRPIWLLEDAGEVVAFLVVRVDGKTRIGELASLGRDPSQRGKGLGSCIMLKAQALLNDQNAESYFLHVVGSNQKALKLYQQCGFQLSGEERVFTRPIHR